MPNERLGSGSEDVLEIKRQSFFDQIDWEKLEARKVTPPWKPDVKGATSVAAIAREFVDEPVSLSLLEPYIGSGPNKDPLFQNFTYVNDTAMNH